MGEEQKETIQAYREAIWNAMLGNGSFRMPERHVYNS